RMNAQCLGDDAGRDDIIENLIDQYGQNNRDQSVGQRAKTEWPEGLKICHQRQRRPGDKRADIWNELCKPGQERDPYRVAHSEYAQDDRIRERGKKENDDLAAQKGIPDQAKLVTEPADVLGIPGDVEPDDPFAQAAALA